MKRDLCLCDPEPCPRCGGDRGDEVRAIIPGAGWVEVSPKGYIWPVAYFALRRDGCVVAMSVDGDGTMSEAGEGDDCYLRPLLPGDLQAMATNMAKEQASA